MKIRLASVLLLISVLLTAWISVGYAMGTPMHRGGGERLASKLSKDLDLTKDQKQTLLKMITKTETEVATIEAQNKGLFNKMQIEMQKDDPDVTVISGYLAQIGTIRTQAEIKRMKMLIEFKRYLTPEQVNKFGELQKQKKERLEKNKKMPAAPPKQTEKRPKLTKEQLESVRKLSPEQIEVLKDLTPEQLDIVKEMKNNGFKKPSGEPQPNMQRQ